MHFRLFSIAVCATLSLTNVGTADQLEFQGVFHQGDGGVTVTEPVGRNKFLNLGSTLTSGGLRLDDVETEIHNGRRVYAGAWASGSGANLFAGPIGPIDLRELMIKRRDQGLRLVDFEIFRSATGGRRYLAVWKPGTGEETLTGPMQQAAFLARGEQLTANGLRLVDVEVEIHQDTLFYHGLFQTGSGANFITTPQERVDFIKTRNERVSDGLELVDVERVETDGAPRYVGVWSSGTGESRFSLLRNFDDFNSLVREQRLDGRELADLELRRVQPEQGPPGNGQDGQKNRPVALNLPENPRYLRLVQDFDFQITREENAFGDPFSIEVPIDALPRFLPRDDDGFPILPDNFCALNIRNGFANHWIDLVQNESLERPPFINNNNLDASPPDQHLIGLRIGGPFGACFGSHTTEWQFEHPLTEQGTLPANQPAQWRFVLETTPPNNPHTKPGIDFLESFGPSVKPIDVDKLFKDKTKDMLKDVAKLLLDVDEKGRFCQTVGDYWRVVCEKNKPECFEQDASKIPLCVPH